jgi:hypothetical protein
MTKNGMRTILAVSLVLAVGVEHARAQVGTAEAGARDRARLIEGVREIAAPGAPGSLVQWLVRLSKAVGKNLGPFFQA